MLLPHETITDSPSAPAPSVATPYSSSAILSDCPAFLREDGIHPSAGVDAGGAAGGAKAGGVPAAETAVPAIGGIAPGAGMTTGAGGAVARIAPWTPNSF